jgi:hypothetical protein
VQSSSEYSARTLDLKTVPVVLPTPFFPSETNSIAESQAVEALGHSDQEYSGSIRLEIERSDCIERHIALCRFRHMNFACYGLLWPCDS